MTSRDAIRQVLKEHYLQQVICDPERRADNPVCQCSRVFPSWHSSVSAAVDAWIGHVLGELEQLS